MPMKTYVDDPRHDDDVIRRLRTRYRWTWGAIIAVTGFLLLTAFIAAWIFALWLWNLIKDSPTIS
jgi:hypothetical protein